MLLLLLVFSVTAHTPLSPSECWLPRQFQHSVSSAHPRHCWGCTPSPQTLLHSVYFSSSFSSRRTIPLLRNKQAKWGHAFIRQQLWVYPSLSYIAEERGRRATAFCYSNGLSDTCCNWIQMLAFSLSYSKFDWGKLLGVTHNKLLPAHLELYNTGAVLTRKTSMQTVQLVKTNQFFLTRNSAVRSSIVLVPDLDPNRSGKTTNHWFFGRINNESSISCLRSRREVRSSNLVMTLSHRQKSIHSRQKNWPTWQNTQNALDTTSEYQHCKSWHIFRSHFILQYVYKTYQAVLCIKLDKKIC